MPEFNDLYSDSFVLEMPSAPPGMPQRMEGIEVYEYRSWMARTVRQWDYTPELLVGTHDPNVFFAIGNIHAQVYWGHQDGVFDSRYIAKLCFESGKLRYLKQMLDPLAYLRAAAGKCPFSTWICTTPELKPIWPSSPRRAPLKCWTMPPRPGRKRAEDNLAMHMSGDFQVSSQWATWAPGAKEQRVVFAPEMRNDYPEALLPGWRPGAS